MYPISSQFVIILNFVDKLIFSNQKPTEFFLYSFIFTLLKVDLQFGHDFD